jgi:YgiT-type zinc finger domain-containing protein
MNPEYDSKGASVTSEQHCEVCHVGVMRLRRTTYTSWLDSQLIILPDVSVWVCDVCGEFVYETDAIARTEALLGVERVSPGAARQSDAWDDTDHLAGLISIRRRGA